jgi:uncharacterized Zn-binding protein involved in type VI secretion
MRAARFDDPIGHTYALEGLIGGSALGAAVGVVAGAAVVVGVGIFAALTAPLSIPALLGAAALTTTGVLSMAGGGLVGAAIGAGIGEFVGSLSAVSGLTSRGFTGKIAGGSPDVFINSKKAARIGIDVVALIAMGSGNVFINDYPAARMDDKVSCGAKIKEGSEDVYIGGEQEKFMQVDEEVSGGVRGLVLGTAAAGAMILGGAVALPVLGAALGTAGALLVGEAAGLLVFGVSLGVGVKADPVFRSVGRNVGEILHNVFGFNVLPSEFEDGASLLGGSLLGWLGVKGAGIVGRSRPNRATLFTGIPFGSKRGPKHGDKAEAPSTVPLRRGTIVLSANEIKLVKESREAYNAATYLLEEMFRPWAANKDKVVATTAGGKSTLSGYSEGTKAVQKPDGNTPRNLPENFGEVSPRDVLSYSERIGHKPAKHPTFDRNFEGEYQSSHGEIQAAILRPNEPIGVTKNMCSGCMAFFEKQATATGETQVVTDPRGTWVFRPGQQAFNLNDH